MEEQSGGLEGRRLSSPAFFAPPHFNSPLKLAPAMKPEERRERSEARALLPIHYLKLFPQNLQVIYPKTPDN